jgi:plasmid rolling circle replication initiator protein Rep
MQTVGAGCSGSVAESALDSRARSDTPAAPNQDLLVTVDPTQRRWDAHKLQAEQVAYVLAEGDYLQRRQALRMSKCGEVLNFGWMVDPGTGATNLKLKSTWFCRVRHCPVCQWRRSLMWIGRFYHAFPRIYADHPDWRYVLLTLTVRNCPVLDLRKTVQAMNAAWKRLTERKAWPADGFVRSLEITRADDGSAHPHFHCLLALPPSYFAGRNYLSAAKWATLWQEALRIDYTPICDVRVVKAKDYSKSRGKTVWSGSPEVESQELAIDGVRNAVLEESGRGLLAGYDPLNNAFQVTKVEAIKAAIAEVIKYTVKPDDMLSDPAWLLELSSQLRNSRAVAIGGEFRKYFDDEDPEGLITEGQPDQVENHGGLLFGWRERASVPQYARKKRELSSC